MAKPRVCAATDLNLLTLFTFLVNRFLEICFCDRMQSRFMASIHSHDYVPWVWHHMGWRATMSRKLSTCLYIYGGVLGTAHDAGLKEIPLLTKKKRKSSGS